MKHRKSLNTIIKNFFIVGCLSVLVSGASAAVTVEEDPYPLFFLQRNLSRILVNDNIAPPLAARDYVYPQLASYYLLWQHPGKKLYTSIKHFPSDNLSSLPKNYSHSLAASFAFYEVAKNIIYTRQPFIDSFAVLVDWYKKKGITEGQFKNSKQVGEQVARVIIAWLNKDRFAETRRMNKYVLLKSPGKWQITPPGYFPAVEPHWGEIRPMLVQKPYSFENLLPIAFDTATTSSFYKEAYHVYATGNHLTDEQKLIASFWDCNPFALHPTGHINTIVKKISPGGHWMNITAIACKTQNLDLEKTSQAFTLCAIALHDAFIYTWDLKYQYNYLRPETYIEQMGIDAGWQPYIQSPPFPEFPSGHAVISNAAAGVLTSLFGNNFKYTDNTETEFGLGPRDFPSFQFAADEATISRVYGGIHFLFSCKTGQEMGKLIAKDLLGKAQH